MSLETSLELNNQLLAQHNALLERLIRTMHQVLLCILTRFHECRNVGIQQLKLKICQRQ
ncbi:Uncharacterised protein [Escherichia coli]|uniref:Uncharacterized protein n=1 Tax=Escherichia coli TaxID=562 RepID=A0A376U5S9_ECOLX|nr:Uncharacterised protein [Escherichia coli]